MIIHTGNHCNSNCRHVSRTCSCTSVQIIVFFFVVDLRGGITRSDSESEDRRIKRLPLLFALPFPSIDCGLLIFLHAHVTSSDSEIRGIEMLFLFSVRTASSSTCGLFLHAQSSMNFNTNQFRVMNCDDILSDCTKNTTALQKSKWLST